jgi:tetratricopeptide (TPR) repeat protein
VQRGLGDLEHKLGNNDAARAAFREALTLYQQVDNRLGQGNVQRGLGDLESRLGNNDAARAAYREALTLYKQVDDPARAGQRAARPRRSGKQAREQRRGAGGLSGGPNALQAGGRPGSGRATCSAASAIWKANLGTTLRHAPRCLRPLFFIRPKVWRMKARRSRLL